MNGSKVCMYAPISGGCTRLDFLEFFLKNIEIYI
jgi:hypothetical protein